MNHQLIPPDMLLLSTLAAAHSYAGFPVNEAGESNRVELTSTVERSVGGVLIEQPVELIRCL